MPLTISSTAIEKKNLIVDDGAWLLFLKFEYPGEDDFCITSNNEITTWAGQSWLPVEFRLGDIEESKEGSTPSVSLSVVDLTRGIIQNLDQYGGGVNCAVTISMCHSSNLASSTPERQFFFSLLDTTVDYANKVTFKLGGENLLNYRFPQDRFLKSNCRYKEFKGDLCGYTGSETTCDRTFTQCRNYGNQPRCGCFPSVGRIGIFK